MLKNLAYISGGKAREPFLVVYKDQIDEEAFGAFKKAHAHKRGKKDAIGSKFTFEITPSSLGNFVSVTCNFCKASQNLTDLDKM